MALYIPVACSPRVSLLKIWSGPNSFANLNGLA